MAKNNEKPYDPNQFFYSAPVKEAEVKPKKVKVIKPKEVVTEKSCPGCKQVLHIAEFTLRHKVYKHCTICREAACVDEDRHCRDELAKHETMFTPSLSLRLARCRGCGRINPMVSDFPVNLTTATGFGKYCQPNCKGKQPCPKK